MRALSRWLPGAPVVFRLLGGVLGCLLGVALLSPTPAQAVVAKRAAKTKAKAPPSAKELLDKATAAVNVDDFIKAEKLLADSYRLSPRPEVLYQLGRIAVRMRRPLEAQDLMRRYLADSSRLPDEAAAREAEAITSEPLPTHGSLSIQAEAGAIVYVDGRLVGSLPLSQPLLLSVGSHSVSLLVAAGRIESTVQISAGQGSELRPSPLATETAQRSLPSLVIYSELALLAPTSGGSPGSLAPRSKRLVENALAQAVREERYTAISTEVALLQGSDLRSCLGTDRCQRSLARANQAEFVLTARGTASANGKATYGFDVALLRVDIAEPAASATMRCEDCETEQAVQKLRETAAKVLSDGLHRPRGRLQLTSGPNAIMLRIDQRPEQISPLEEPVWAGTRVISSRHPGFLPYERSVEVKDGETLAFHVELSDERGSYTPRARPRYELLPRPKWRLAVGGAGVGAGVALLVLGIVGVAQDGACKDAPSVTGAACPLVYDTAGLGGGAIGLGLALTAGGAVLLALPGPRRPVAAKP